MNKIMRYKTKEEIRAMGRRPAFTDGAVLEVVKPADKLDGMFYVRLLFGAAHAKPLRPKLGWCISVRSMEDIP